MASASSVCPPGSNVLLKIFLSRRSMTRVSGTHLLPKNMSSGTRVLLRQLARRFTRRMSGYQLQREELVRTRNSRKTSYHVSKPWGTIPFSLWQSWSMLTTHVCSFQWAVSFNAKLKEVDSFRLPSDQLFCCQLSLWHPRRAQGAH